jgi:hypothetical protein
MTEPKARWKIPLRLNHILSDTELNRWLHLFDSPKCKVSQKQDGRYCLTACRFEKFDKADEVKKSAEKLITMLTAFAKIELDIDFKSITNVNKERLVGAVLEDADDSGNVTVYPETPGAYASAMQPTVEIRDKDGNVVTQPRQARWWDCYLDQCDDSVYNTAAFKALSHFAEKSEARTIRLTYETVRNDEGGKKKVLRNCWMTEDELDRFWCSIHRSDITSPLHAKMVADPTDPTCNMTIDEMRTFCALNVLKPWLIKKQQGVS